MMMIYQIKEGMYDVRYKENRYIVFALVNVRWIDIVFCQLSHNGRGDIEN